MSEDVKTLREAAKNFEEWFEHGNLQQLWPREQKALSILCARVADMIEREEQQEQAAPATGHPIHPPSYDEGWNAALDAVGTRFETIFLNGTWEQNTAKLFTELRALRRLGGE